ncbi:hypothetical protein CXT86_02760 [Akkermansia muciniphila]|nr:hypothetical protein CXT93_11630 [Akkermansia muciniphila]PND07130.1 hypothetical protein CXT86_02760 [Akkermansia muciniphila]PND10613.1 hypothetical protein CXT85_03345 [Akkermansia muciniphila]
MKNCAAPWIEFTSRSPLFSSKKTPEVGLYRYFSPSLRAFSHQEEERIYGGTRYHIKTALHSGKTEWRGTLE